MDYQLYYHINEIQDLKRNPKQDLYALWQECFGDSKEYTDLYFDWKVKENQVLTIYHENTLCAMLHLNPYTIVMGGKRIQANYIVGVATKPEYRKQGLMKTLLEGSLKQMYEEHRPFTYLMPAAEAIYLPYDFRIIYEQEPWRANLFHNDSAILQAAEISTNPNNTSIIPLKAKDSKRMEELVYFSNNLLGQLYDVYTERSIYYFASLIQEAECEHGEVLLCYIGEQLVGYMAYMTGKDIHIMECLCDPENKDTLYSGISDYLAEFNYPGQNTDIITDNFTPTIMVRIVDWKSFIQNITACKETVLIIEVKDKIINENNGIYRLCFSSNGCIVEETIQPADIVSDIADLTELFFGRINLNKQNSSIIINKDIYKKLTNIDFYKCIFINEIV